MTDVNTSISNAQQALHEYQILSFLFVICYNY